LHDLRQVTDPQVGRHVNPAGRGALLPGNQFHQGGLSSPVLSDEPDFVRLTDVEADIVQQGETPEGNRYIID
jgi:hypothetical protein